ncbi:MAG TPA: FAD binding domain-containing protein [Candidatus Polarisedimenticolia bacterium]|nr:FAD binding domain-containing protein [Candidatus Polarisedimenticolia bacterium]
MILPPFRLHRPASLDEAAGLAASLSGGFDFLGGGTDLLPNYKNRLNPRRDVIALWRIGELRSRGEDSIGAMTRLSDLEEDPAFRLRHPGLAEAIDQVASPLIRRQATLGGNVLVETRCYYFNQSRDWRASKGYCMKADGDVCLVVPQKEVCYAAYSGDTAAVLLALDARLVLHGPAGAREVRSREFFQPDGIRKNVLARGEILSRVVLPPASSSRRSGYAKLRLRDSFDFPEAGVAAALELDGAVVKDLSLAVTAVSMTPVLLEDLTGPALGERLTPDLIRHLADGVAARSQPVRNVMFPPQYRKRMTGVLARRLLSRLALSAGPRRPL